MQDFMLRDLLEGLIVSVTIVFIAFSPIARAIADRIRHGRLPRPGESAEAGRVDDLSGEVAALRHQLGETQERLDFAERLLAQTRSKGALGAGAEPEGR